MTIADETVKPRSDIYSDRLRAIWPSACFDTPRAGIVVAVTPDDLTEIGRLRYELYIQRDRKAYAHANPRSRTFIEPIDLVSLNFKAVRTDQLLGTVRLTQARDALDDPHLSRLVQFIDPTHLSRTVINSRFSIRPAPGARVMIIPMFESVYRAGLAAGAKHSFLATRSNLTGIFERFGWQQSGHRFCDAIAGSMEILRIDLHDLDNLRRTRSPLLGIAEEWFDGDHIT